MAEYTITNVGANKRLTIKRSANSNMVVNELYQNQNLEVKEKSGTNEQRWIVNNLGNNVYIKSKINLGFGLNIYRDGTNKCDVHTISGNETDAAINIVSVGGRHRIQLANYPDYYLTVDPDAETFQVYWHPLIAGSPYQTWHFYEIPVPESYTIEDYPEIFNQNSLSSQILKDYGCCVCCCCNAATYYRRLKDSNASEYTVPGLQEAYGIYVPDSAESLFNNYPDVAFSFSFTSNVDEIFTVLHSEISEGRPVLICITKDGSASGYPDTTHWVVAYGYKSLTNAWSEIEVLNPVDINGSNVRGRHQTLQQALNDDECYATSINRIEPTLMKP